MAGVRSLQACCRTLCSEEGQVRLMAKEVRMLQGSSPRFKTRRSPCQRAPGVRGSRGSESVDRAHADVVWHDVTSSPDGLLTVIEVHNIQNTIDKSEHH